jgi:endonuclease YncB( thermonuclease family)
MNIAAKLVAIVFGVAVLWFFAWVGTGSFGVGKTEPEPSVTAEAIHQPAQTPPTASLGTTETSAPAAAPKPSTTPTTIGEEKHLRLAREEAEVERDASLAKQHAIEPVTPVKLHYRVKVRDGGTLQAGGVVIRLAEIEAREADGRCTDKNGKDWACGSAARVALAKFIRYRAISCGLPDDGEQTDYVARCSVGGVDLSEWMVRQGWAKPKPNADKVLADAADAAKLARLGIWRASE